MRKATVERRAKLVIFTTDASGQCVQILASACGENYELALPIMFSVRTHRNVLVNVYRAQGQLGGWRFTARAFWL